MASVRKRGNSYQVTVSGGYDIDGKKISQRRSFKKPGNVSEKQWDKKLQKLVIEFELEVESGRYVDRSITLKQFSERWMKDYVNSTLSYKSQSAYKTGLDTKILPVLGHKKLYEVQPTHILQFLNNLMEDGVKGEGKTGGYSDSTIGLIFGILSSLMQQAVYWGVLYDNPCKRVKVPKHKKSLEELKNRKIKHFNEEQIGVLMDEISGELLQRRVAFFLALFCGMRMGEVLGLTWNDIDFKEQTIDINTARSYTPEKGLFTKIPKTAGSLRVISYPSALNPILREYKLSQNAEKAFMGPSWDDEWNRTPWLMTKKDGTGLGYSTLTNWLKNVIKKYNKRINADKKLSDKDKKNKLLPVYGFHALRHTSATLLIGENTDIKTVSMRLGHSNTTTTMNIYVHGLNSKDREASDKLNRLFTDNTDQELSIKHEC
ncbi:Site-specific recombinase XerD [Dethiosulfatibacter aminovorans DSM 17477]|uniref:Site-specific recombinase XerD n=1 Tax=Dethiosulfatibacter aminovorans DSM 17477 TaxID=1121476 RepID=A0A1M6LG10_9FIRM|nr:site-specific integrase [Dethiosulfatibacter aminovorans]SHJ70137.1 Site-specific recombinase XerD [Dethiosulfatibacter aminovorans DSM 17477]